jgi:hypothetical protein
VNVRLQAFALVLGILGGTAALSAHHSWPVSRARLVTVKGTVTAFTWTNPHPMISLDVRRDDGTIEKWSVGGPAINRMSASGWNNTTVKPGDVITGIGYQFSDGQKIIRLERVLLPNGKELPVYAR